MGIKSSLPTALKYQALVIEQAARDVGLDFHDVVFELLAAEDVNGIAACGGFPVRYPNWRFGMEYERLQKGYRWGVSKIYELVINNDPTYAYLVQANSLLEQKLVMAHVYGHADFFKHNAWFAPTDRHMLDTMASDATRVRRFIDAHGQERVERFLDQCLSLETLIDPYLPLREQRMRAVPAGPRPSERALRALESIGGEPRAAQPASAAPARSLLGCDVLGFLVERAPLESWERDVLGIVRREAYYFSPQRMTKIMNEGWATYWHSRILTGGLLEPDEIVDFADCHSAATAAAPGRLNPYKLGLELFRLAHARRMDLWRLRRAHSDVTLIDELVDEDFLEERGRACGLEPLRAAEGEPASWGATKQRLLQELCFGGLPRIELVAEASGTLELVHHHDGRDLDLEQARATLLCLAALWKGPVQLLTLEQRQGRRLACDGRKVDVLETKEALARCSPAA